MVFRTVGIGSGATMVIANQLDIGTVFEGVLVDKTKKDSFDKLKYRLKLKQPVTFPSKKKEDPAPSPYHAQPGEEVDIVSGGGSLDYSLQDVPIGTLLKLTYQGKHVIDKGKRAGKEAKSWLVEVDVPELATVSEPTAKEEIPF